MAKKRKHPTAQTPVFIKQRRQPKVGRPKSKGKTKPPKDAVDEMDLLTEDVVELAKLVKEFPAGARPHPSTIWRWAMRGVRGITLEKTWVGGSLYSSTQALQRFLVATQQEKRKKNAG